MKRLYQGGYALLLAVGLSGCSLFSGDEESAKPVPTPLQDIAEVQSTLQKVWSKSIGKGDLGTQSLLVPALDSYLFVSDSKGVVTAMDPANGKTIWEVALKDVQVGSAVTAASGMVLLGTLKGEVIALSQADGAELWRGRVSSEVIGLPATDGSYVAVQSIDDAITVFDAISGEKLWSQESVQPALTLRGTASPLIFKEVVFAGFANGEARAYRLTDGALAWISRIASPSGSSELERLVDVNAMPVIVDNKVVFTSFQGNVTALELYSGRLDWSKPMSSYEPVNSGFGNIYAVSEQSDLSALDQDSGKENWALKDFQYRMLSAPAVYSNYVVVGDVEGYVHLVSQTDGVLAGRYHATSAAIQAQPLINDGMIYVLSTDGELVALQEPSIQ